MQIGDEQRASFSETGFMIVPGYLDAAELDLARGICDASVAAIERDMRARRDGGSHQRAG